MSAPIILFERIILSERIILLLSDPAPDRYMGLAPNPASGAAAQHSTCRGGMAQHIMGAILAPMRGIDAL